MYIAESKFTSKIDKYCIEKYKIPEIILMENAASAAFERLEKIEHKINIDLEKISVICGSGNNGGDGFAIARKLSNTGKDIEIITVGNLENMSSSAKTNFEICINMGIKHIHFDEEDYDKVISSLKKSDEVVDCLFGVGLNRDIEGEYKKVIELINKYKAKYDYNIVAIDIPSGLNGTTGEVMGVSVLADYTITFEFFKRGFLRYSSEKYLGKIYVEEIGVPYKLYNDIDILPSFIDENYILDNLIPRNDTMHKGDFGKVAIAAGSNGFYGAAYISSSAAVNTGSGLTTLICTEDTQSIIATKLTEAMTCPYSDGEKLEKILKTVDALAIGPGMGDTDKTKRFLKRILDNIDAPVVIDADGINVFEKDFLNKDSQCILTPHLGEFSRLTGVSIEDIQKDRIFYAEKYAKENEIVIVLKGKNTIVTDGIRTMVNTTGNSGMANGGMGDALTGMITSLCGQGYDIFVASCMGVYIHGLCGDKIYKEKQVVTASEILKIIPNELKILYNKIK
ncbi:MAG: NAD(P)H-hydrate dehydratase [Peptostreptococcus sp.]|uniref:NAD(P)H-hydrate dehydratase n=1 Tax=Peptostreptococcus sp. TaxID=1262 RepID=UPI002FCA072A